MDVDHFKLSNDTLGHAGGDAVLLEFGRRLKASVRAMNIVWRLAGDEFTIVLEDLNDVAALIARKIRATFSKPVQLEQASLQVSTSIGIAFVQRLATDIQTLSHQADADLYHAKANDRGQYAIPEVR